MRRAHEMVFLLLFGQISFLVGAISYADKPNSLTASNGEDFLGDSYLKVRFVCFVFFHTLEIPR